MKTILLLEDLPEIRAWLRKLVLQVFPDSQISESARVTTRWPWCSAVKFDLALVDLGLPDGRASTWCTKLRDVQPEAQSVVVTIHDDDEHLFPALQAGAFGYILKEQARELITEQLQRISQGEPPLSPVDRAPRDGLLQRQGQAAGNPTLMPQRVADRPRERSAAARGQGLHAARDRRAAGPEPPHDRRLRQADLPQAQRELARRGRAGSAAPGAVRPLKPVDRPPYRPRP
jgi:DNA-binding NarL/FixJ family response regulator